MIYHGMTPNPALSAGMVLTEHEQERLKASSLRKGCRISGTKFVCEYREGRKDVYLGTYETIEQCNKAWDNHHEIAGERKAGGKGYHRIALKTGGYSYKCAISYDGRARPLGTFKTPEAAKAQYELAVQHINMGTFMAWFEGLRK